MGRILEDDSDVRGVLRDAKRVAVLGIKPESRRAAPAFYVPNYLQRVGYEIIPVPVYYPEVTEILGEPVYRSVAAVPGVVDLVVVFRRSADIPPHVADIIAKQPKAVWFQAGIHNDVAARRLADAGIDVVQNRCTMVEHRADQG
ncbi:MAG TPA: CoA-binding protein [Longimicrobiales bacterium]|nr:CoA-binding protein [Longimicrobiales bacterium]